MEGAAVGPGAWSSEHSGAAELTPLGLSGARGLSGAGSACGEQRAQRRVCKAWPCPVPLTALVPSPSAKDAQAAAGQTRNFLVRASCRLRLEPGKEYLIMGLDGSTHDLKGQ